MKHANNVSLLQFRAKLLDTLYARAVEFLLKCKLRSVESPESRTSALTLIVCHSFITHFWTCFWSLRLPSPSSSCTAASIIVATERQILPVSSQYYAILLVPPLSDITYVLRRNQEVNTLIFHARALSPQRQWSLWPSKWTARTFIGCCSLTSFQSWTTDIAERRTFFQSTKIQTQFSCKCIFRLPCVIKCVFTRVILIFLAVDLRYGSSNLASPFPLFTRDS